MVRRAQPPTDQIASIESDAEEIRGDEAELRGAHANDADDRAVHSSNDPAVPEFPAEEEGGEDREHARDVVQTQQVVKQVCHLLFESRRPKQQESADRFVFVSTEGALGDRALFLKARLWHHF